MTTDLPALPEPSYPLVDVLAKWEDQNGTMSAVLPSEWDSLRQDVMDACVVQSPRMLRECIAARDAEIARLGKLAADYFAAAVEAQERAERLSEVLAETGQRVNALAANERALVDKLSAALAAQQPAAGPTVWEAASKTTNLLFASKALAEEWRAGFPPSVAGGIFIRERIVVAAAPAVQPHSERVQTHAEAAAVLAVNAALHRLEAGRPMADVIEPLRAAQRALAAPAVQPSEREQPAEPALLVPCELPQWAGQWMGEDGRRYVLSAAPSAQPVAAPGAGELLSLAERLEDGADDQGRGVVAEACFVLRELAAAPSAPQPQKGDAA